MSSKRVRALKEEDRITYAQYTNLEDDYYTTLPPVEEIEHYIIYKKKEELYNIVLLIAYADNIRFNYQLKNDLIHYLLEHATNNDDREVISVDKIINDLQIDRERFYSLLDILFAANIIKPFGNYIRADGFIIIKTNRIFHGEGYDRPKS